MWPRYTVDLAGMHTLYELNYARMVKLLRGAGVFGRVGFITPIEFAWGESVRVGALCLPQPVLQLSRVEQTRYTETWRLAQMTPTLPWCPELDMEVRLYHDADMADVLRFQRARRIPAIVGLADAQGWRVNEKELVNRFLGDCLQHCLAYGHARDPRLLPDFSRWDGLSRPPVAPSEDVE